MRQAFAAIDDILIERVFQPLADTLFDYVGLSRLRAASVCVELSAVAWVLSQAPEMSAAVLAWQAGSAMLHVVLLFLGLTALLSLRQLFRRMARANANPLRLAMQNHRAVVLLLLLAQLSELRAIRITDTADLAMLGFMTMALYMSACAAPPPVRRSLPITQLA